MSQRGLTYVEIGNLVASVTVPDLQKDLLNNVKNVGKVNWDTAILSFKLLDPISGKRKAQISIDTEAHAKIFVQHFHQTLFYGCVITAAIRSNATQGKTQPKPESQENPKSRSQSQDSTEPKAENQDGTKSRTQSQDGTKSRTQSQDSLNNSTSSTSLESNVNTSIKFRDVRLDPNYEKEKKALLEQREAQNQLQNRNLNPYQPNQSKPIQPTQPPQQKEQPKETQKEIPKEEPKEQPKEPKKEQSTEQSKVTQKEEPKEEQLKEQPKQQPKENNHLPRTESNDNVPKNENSKEPSPSLQPTKTNNDEVQFIEKLDEIKKSQDDLKQEIISAQNNLKILLEKWEFLDSKIKELEKKS